MSRTEFSREQIDTRASCPELSWAVSYSGLIFFRPEIREPDESLISGFKILNVLCIFIVKIHFQALKSGLKKLGQYEACLLF